MEITQNLSYSCTKNGTVNAFQPMNVNLFPRKAQLLLLREGDSVVSACSSGDEEVMLLTRKGMVFAFALLPTKAAIGVKALL